MDCFHGVKSTWDEAQKLRRPLITFCSHDSASIPNDVKDCIIIIDDIHYACQDHNTPLPKTLSSILALDKEEMATRNIFFVFVSATVNTTLEDAFNLFGRGIRIFHIREREEDGGSYCKRACLTVMISSNSSQEVSSK